MQESIPTVSLEKMRGYFNSGKTLPLTHRAAALRRLRAELILREQELCDAVEADFGRSAFDTMTCELLQVKEEIDTALKHLVEWAAPRPASGGAWNFPSSAVIRPEPLGVVLILSPWNYPILLALSPLVGAVASGNCVVLRPSQRTSNTAQVLDRLVRASFLPCYVSVAMGNHALSDRLLEERFDLIFFTGSTEIGRLVMQAAARHLTPVVLELGGKSPCIVDETAAIPEAARRIVWGKLLNAGQTCVAPDYLLVQQSIADDLMKALCREMKARGDIPNIITPVHAARLKSIIEQEKIVFGGGVDVQGRRVEPTILYPVSPDSPCMQEELFGPVLPVIVYETLDQAIELIRSREKPLALYHFSRNRKAVQRVLQHTSAGGGCVNDTVLHVASPGLAFGGVGMSGMGRYHGKDSFDTFSNPRGLLIKPAKFELPLRYPPHPKWMRSAVRAMLRG